MPFLHALTDYRQIAEEDVEKPHTYGNHVQRGSANHSVKGGLAFLWEMRFFDPTQLSHKWTDNNESLHTWLRHGDHAPCTFSSLGSFWFTPGKGVKYHGKCLSLFFVRFSIDTPRDYRDRPIFSINAPYDVIPLLVVPFGGRNFKYLKFRGVLPQKVPKKGRG